MRIYKVHGREEKLSGEKFNIIYQIHTLTFAWLLALDLEIESNLIWPPVVAGHTAVVPRIFCFHCADDEASIAMDTTTTVNQDICGCSVGA